MAGSSVVRRLLCDARWRIGGELQSVLVLTVANMER